jgi:Cu+-exporting ATPase
MEVTDPVCGMNIDSDKAAGRAEYAGRTYYFCSAMCEQRFKAAPEQYARPEKKPGESGARK